jgi:hypothetical protein
LLDSEATFVYNRLLAVVNGDAYVTIEVCCAVVFFGISVAI